jgi:HEAT repeat protein
MSGTATFSEYGEALSRVRQYERDRNVAGLRRLLDSTAEGDWRTVAGEAANSLARLGCVEAAPAIRAVLEDRSRSRASRFQALYALRLLRDRETVPELISLLRDPWLVMRCAACQSLAVLQAKEAVEPLFDTAIHDPAEEVRALATQALLRCGDPRGPELLEAGLRTRRFLPLRRFGRGRFWRILKEDWHRYGADPDAVWPEDFPFDLDAAQRRN